MMENEVVRRRGWMGRQDFLDLVGAANLIPGPNSTELAIHVGFRRAGWKGLLVAGVCFILPAALIVSVLAWGYLRLGALPEVEGALYGVKPVILAVVVQALWRLGRAAIKDRVLALVAAAALAASLLGADELAVLFGAGVAAALARGAVRAAAGAALLPVPALAAASAGAAAVEFGLWPLFFFFLKVGSVLFGSGYVLLAFLRSDLVLKYGWMDDAFLLDAVAVGQVTPGPVFTTATFIGHVLGGPAGGAVATLGIFLPAFVFVAASAPFLPRLRRSVVLGSLLDGVNAGALAVMAAVSLWLGRAAVVDPLTGLLGLAAAVLLIRYRADAGWLVLGGGVVGAVRILLS